MRMYRVELAAGGYHDVRSAQLVLRRVDLATVLITRHLVITRTRTDEAMRGISDLKRESRRKEKLEK